MAVDVEGLYVKYGPMVLRRCRGLLKQEERALDALQDVFVQVIRLQEKLEDRGLSSLLYTMATNICLNIIRKEVKQPQTWEDEILQEVAGVDDHTDRSIARHLTDEFFKGDLASSRTLAVLYFVDGLTLEEAAAAVGMSVSGIRKRLTKIKERGKALREAVL